MFRNGCDKKGLCALDHMGERNWKIARRDLAEFMLDRFSYRGQLQEFSAAFFQLEVVAEKYANFNEPAVASHPGCG